MDQKNIEWIRKKRVRIQQNIITILCMFCIILTIGWIIYKLADKQETVSTDVGNSSVVKDESSEESLQNAENSEESSLNDESSVTDSDDLADAVFVGDSRIVGLMNSTTYPKATFYCAVGLNIDSALTDADITLDNGNSGTIIQALEQKQFGRVYISFGTNEMGWPYIDTFKEHYTTLVKKIQELQPEAQIYCLGILPVTASQDAKGESVNNTNARTFSLAISEVAAQIGVKYLDCSSAVADSSGYLPEEASTDGIHLTSEYCLYWQDYIIKNT